jgi:hypothetical protein
MNALAPYLTRYVELNKRIGTLNAEVKDLREKRSTVELNMAAVYSEPQKEDLPQKIELAKSKMVFQVKRPGEWKKGWTLSKKQLEQYLAEILPEHGEDVFREIVIRHERTLTATTDYSFELKPMGEEST